MLGGNCGCDLNAEHLVVGCLLLVPSTATLADNSQTQNLGNPLSLILWFGILPPGLVAYLLCEQLCQLVHMPSSHGSWSWKRGDSKGLLDSSIFSKGASINVLWFQLAHELLYFQDFQISAGESHVWAPRDSCFC